MRIDARALKPITISRMARQVLHLALALFCPQLVSAVLNNLSFDEINNQGGDSVMQSGLANFGQYGMVIPAGYVPQEISIVVFANLYGGSCDVTGWDWHLNADNATISAFTNGPQFSTPMGPPLRANGQLVGTVTTPEGWTLYDQASYHSESGTGTNIFQQNHQLFFHIAALDSNSPSFNPTLRAFFATSTVNRIISIQSFNDPTAGQAAIATDSNAPTSVYRSDTTPTYVVARPYGAAIDAGPLGSLIQIPQPVATMVAVTTVVATTTFTLNFTNTGPWRMCNVIRSTDPAFLSPRTTVAQFYASSLTATITDTISNPSPASIFWRLERAP